MTTPNVGSGQATIRPACRRDISAIAALLTRAGLPTAGVAEIVSVNPNDFLVAEVDGEVKRLVGVAGLEVRETDALLRSVAVDEAWRSQGVGNDMVREIIDHAKKRRMRALYLLTTTADGYFPRFGFGPIDRANVPKAIATTLEFTSACPDTAIAMSRRLG